MRSLNIEQQRAVLRALSAKDYVLLQGLPGTGMYVIAMYYKLTGVPGFSQGFDMRLCGSCNKIIKFKI